MKDKFVKDKFRDLLKFNNVGQANQSSEKAPQKKIFNRELLVRTISAIILAAGVIYLSWHSFTAFIGLCGVFLVLMCWEWGRLTNNDTYLQLTIQVSSITIAIAAFFLNEWFLFAAILFAAGFLASWSTHYWWRSKWALSGLFYVGLPIFSLIYLRSDPSLGFYAILFLFFVVWGTDTAAYFAGRHFGGKKLAPAISPGKTWSGFFGGLFGGFIIGALFAFSINQNPVIPAVIGLVLSTIAQCGDLFESAIKRHFGVKDSSHLIPGHGGILDRLDGVIFAAIGAAIIAALHNAENPGQGLLIWLL